MSSNQTKANADGPLLRVTVAENRQLSASFDGQKKLKGPGAEALFRLRFPLKNA